MEEQKPFSVDLEKISPEEVIEDIIKTEISFQKAPGECASILHIKGSGIEEVLGKHKEILYIGIRQVKVYSREDMKIYIWSDSRGRENSIFISQKERGTDSEVTWYIDRVEALQKLLKVSNNRDFIEQCVQKQITPESLKK